MHPFLLPLAWFPTHAMSSLVSDPRLDLLIGVLEFNRCTDLVEQLNGLNASLHLEAALKTCVTAARTREAMGWMVLVALDVYEEEDQVYERERDTILSIREAVEAWLDASEGPTVCPHE